LEARLEPLFLALPVFLILGIASLVFRYRRAGPDTRQQMKWLVLTMATPLIVFALFIALEDGLGVSLPNLVWGFLYLLFPLGLAIALLRYKLFDVDTVIRKTAVYTALIVLLALVYFGICCSVSSRRSLATRP
jgi:predicted permease